MHATPPAVRMLGLTKAYGPDTGIFDMDLEIEAGTIVGLIGPSGSGKTTTVHLLTGVTAPDSGTVEVLGETPVHFSKNTRARIGYMPQQVILYPELTLRQNLNFAASLYGMTYRRKKRIDRLVELMELDGAVDRLPSDASGGEKRRVMLAATLIHQPDLVFLDEPTAGIDPVLRRKLWDRFRDLASEERTLLVTTQYVGEAAYCDYVAVLAGGRLLTVDTPEGLRKAAFGGEVMEVVFDLPPGADDVASLQTMAETASVKWVDALRLQLVVDDVDTAATSVAAWASQRDLGTVRAEGYLPPFDDVFVELVSKLDDSEEAGDRN